MSFGKAANRPSILVRVISTNCRETIAFPAFVQTAAANSTMAKAVVGRPRAPAPLALGLGQGKGSAGRSGPAAPLTGAAAASPLAKMAASSHVSNRKWRRSKGEGRSAVGGEIVGTGQRRRPCQGGVGARPPAWGLRLSSLFPFARPSFALRHLLQFIKLS